MSNSNQITVYEANSREKIGFFRGWFIMVVNIIQFRELIYVLFKRDFFAVYKKSFLGISWLFISPIIGVISWVFINAAGVLQPGETEIPYPAYVLLSSSIWALFIGFYTSAQGTITSGSSIINQVKYPHEILLIKQIAQHLAISIISFIMNIFVLLVMGVIPSWKIVLIPLFILPLLFLGAGIGLIISVFSVLSPEIQKGFDILMGLLIWITPVIYSPKFDNPSLQNIIKWNPLTYLIDAPRQLFISGDIANEEQFVIASFFSFLVFLFSWRFFFVTEDKVIEKLL